MAIYYTRCNTDSQRVAQCLYEIVSCAIKQPVLLCKTYIGDRQAVQVWLFL